MLNIEPCHEHLFFDDGTNENLGFFPPRKGKNEKYNLDSDDNSLLDGYDMGPNIYDDARMRRALDMVNARIRCDNVEYSLIGDYWLYAVIPPFCIPMAMHLTKYNCQDFCTELKITYLRLLITDTLEEMF